jgi:heptosyltransferase-2
MSHVREKILIIRLSSIGDILQCSAIPRVLQKTFASCEVHWIVRGDNTDLVKHNPYVAKTISFDRASGLLGLLRLAADLKKQGYTRVYDAHNNWRSHVLVWILRPSIFIRRSKERIKRLVLFWFKKNLFTPGYKSVTSYLVPLQGWNVIDDGLGPEIFLSPSVHQKARDLLEPSKKWIAVMPGAAWPKKRWPMANWIAVVKELLRTTQFNFVILGGPKDVFCADLELDRERILNLAGTLSLLESAAVTARCEAMISADTGLMHMAEALGKNVVGIIGPTPFGDPFRLTSRGLKGKVWCQPCSKDGRGICVNFEYQKCMKLITPEMAVTALSEVIPIQWAAAKSTQAITHV